MTERYDGRILEKEALSSKSVGFLPNALLPQTHHRGMAVADGSPTSGMLFACLWHGSGMPLVWLWHSAGLWDASGVPLICLCCRSGMFAACLGYASGKLLASFWHAGGDFWRPSGVSVVCLAVLPVMPLLFWHPPGERYLHVTVWCGIQDFYFEGIRMFQASAHLE